jgi:L-ascorbate metabolism protein UlaG (beta-lactamase superfamily)
MLKCHSSMEITYLGHSSFKIKGKEASLITDPYESEMVGIKYRSQSADILLISHEHNDHNRSDLVKDVRFEIRNPGEYEFAGVSVFGYTTYHDDIKGEKRGKNTVYVVEIDGIKIAHLGDIGHIPSEKQVEEFGEIDILMIPVGGFYTISADEAVQAISLMEPKLVLPMHYKFAGINEDNFSNLGTLEDFLKISGMTVERLDKLKISVNDIKEEQKVVVLEKVA